MSNRITLLPPKNVSNSSSFPVNSYSREHLQNTVQSITSENIATVLTEKFNADAVITLTGAPKEIVLATKGWKTLTYYKDSAPRTGSDKFTVTETLLNEKPEATSNNPLKLTISIKESGSTLILELEEGILYKHSNVGRSYDKLIPLSYADKDIVEKLSEVLTDTTKWGFKENIKGKITSRIVKLPKK